jgi:hypothetical protein
MPSYPESYLSEIVETQGKLFDFYASSFEKMDTEHFIRSYMKSQTRRYIDSAQPYVCTMDAQSLWDFFLKTDKFEHEPGTPLKGFLPDWIGEFYAYYQWYFNTTSSSIIDKIPIHYLEVAYSGLHDLDLDLAVKKVGKV